LFVLRRVCTVVFVLGRIYTMMLMVDEVEHWEGVELELRPGGVAVCSLLNPFRLVGFTIQRQAILIPSPELGQIPSSFTLVLRPPPEPETRPLVCE